MTKLPVYKIQITNRSSWVTFEAFIKANTMGEAIEKAKKKFKYPIYTNHFPLSKLY
jgi:hypothetical protein